MNVVEKKILRINPSYLAVFDEFIKHHSQFGGGAASDKYVEGRAFSNVYEMYIYAYFLGIYNGTKLDIVPQDDTRTFWEMENWKPRELVKYLISCAIAKSDFDMVAIEHADESGVNSEIKVLKAHIEAFANGGLRLMKDLFEEDPELIQDDMFMIRLITKKPSVSVANT